jgi:hypothetical protein
MSSKNIVSLEDSLANFAESIFLEAKLNPSLRQSYIDNRNWKSVLPFVEKISYVSSKKDEYSTIKPWFFNIRKKFNSSIGIFIELHDNAFDNVFIDKEIEFLHSIYNHAGYEAYEKYVSHPIRNKHRNFLLPDGGRYVQELLNKIRVDKYFLNVASRDLGSNYKMFLENIIDHSEKQLLVYFSSVNRYSKFIDIRHGRKILEENNPIIETPLFEF